MRIRSVGSAGEDKVELQMTPMIDIVFQMLVFFVMTFKIVTIEGDFNIKMPLASQNVDVQVPPLPPLRVRLTADAAGVLNGIQLGDKPLRNFGELRAEIMQVAGTDSPSAGANDLEVELDCDFNLNYTHTIQAVTAVSGHRVGDEIRPLVEKIRFAPPRTGAE